MYETLFDGSVSSGKTDLVIEDIPLLSKLMAHGILLSRTRISVGTATMTTKVCLLKQVKEKLAVSLGTVEKIINQPDCFPSDEAMENLLEMLDECYEGLSEFWFDDAEKMPMITTLSNTLYPLKQVEEKLAEALEAVEKTIYQADDLPGHETMENLLEMLSECYNNLNWFWWDGTRNAEFWREGKPYPTM